MGTKYRVTSRDVIGTVIAGHAFCVECTGENDLDELEIIGAEPIFACDDIEDSMRCTACDLDITSLLREKPL